MDWEIEPTDEQKQALRLFADGDSMVIEAGAGTGKTSTLELLARSSPRTGRYIAFNKAIVTDAQRRMPATVISSTAHSLAFGAIGRRFAHRLTAPRMRSTELANRLKLTPFTVDIIDAGSKEIAAGYLAGLVMRAIGNFCQGADEEPTQRHVPYIHGIDLTIKGERSYENNNDVATFLLPAIRRAWADLGNRDGHLPYRHDHYLKQWALTHPKIAADYIMLDEAQDTNPVLAVVIDEQSHAQRILVGDSAQQIYEWRGAVNAMADFAQTHRTFLSRSFRFGPAIAAVANQLLARLDTPLRITGTDAIDSQLAPLEEPSVWLTRTNALAVAIVLDEKRKGRQPHLVGGGADVVRFARAALELQTGQPTWHPELACFDSWSEVLSYVADDPQGSELKLLVDLVEEYGVATIIAALEHMTPEQMADTVISTAHKAKGREWHTVRIAGDFCNAWDGGWADDGEVRLAYVAVTRAREILDARTLLTAIAFADKAAADKAAQQRLELPAV